MPLEISRIQAICFDVDGTLWDSDDELVRRLSESIKPLSPVLLNRDPLQAARRLVMALETPGNLVHNLRYQSRLISRLIEFGGRSSGLQDDGRSSPRQLVKGVTEMLSVLASRFPLAVVSARPQMSTLEFLADHDLMDFFKVVVTGQTCRRTKPYPDPVLFAAKCMGVAPQNCLMVGDTTVDILSGRQAGAQTAGVLCGFGEGYELRRAGADLILESTADLLQTLWF
jgi:phosphoglycolate phosphatase-like HAD superfamily hydrolase